MQLTEAATLNRKSGGAEGSAVLRTFRGNVLVESEPARKFAAASGKKLPKSGHYALGTTLAS
jgi:hypothetical protein